MDDFREDFDEPREMATPGEWLLVGIVWLVSTAFVVACGWIAWQAIKRQDPTDLLILAAILIALPAWIVVLRDSNRRRDREIEAARVFAAWLREHSRLESERDRPETWN